MDNYTKLWIDMDADELQTWEREVTRRLEDAKTEVTTQEQALAAIQAELRRRKLDDALAKLEGEQKQWQ